MIHEKYFILLDLNIIYFELKFQKVLINNYIALVTENIVILEYRITTFQSKIAGSFFCIRNFHYFIPIVIFAELIIRIKKLMFYFLGGRYFKDVCLHQRKRRLELKEREKEEDRKRNIEGGRKIERERERERGKKREKGEREKEQERE